MPSRFRLVFLVVCVALGCSSFLLAQAQDTTPSSQEQQQAPPDQDLQVFKAQVNVVNLFFNVKDKHGMLIPNLTKDDFQVLEDGKPQTIKYFSAESNQPLTLGIMIDTSASQTRVLDIEQSSCAEFLKAVLRDKDLAFVINFDVDVDLDQDFTNNIRDLTRALNKMQINAGMGGGPPGLGGGPVPTTPRGTLLVAVLRVRRRRREHIREFSRTFCCRGARPTRMARGFHTRRGRARIDREFFARRSWPLPGRRADRKRRDRRPVRRTGCGRSRLRYRELCRGRSRMRRGRTRSRSIAAR